MKLKLVALAVFVAAAGSAQAQSWTFPGSYPAPKAIYDPSQGPLPLDRRYMMTREGAEAARYEAEMATTVAQAQPAQPAQVASQRNYYDLPKAPAREVVQAPDWFVNLPPDTTDMMFAAATASSVDEQMAYDKARMQAERKLVEVLSSQIRSLTKSYRNDTGDAMIERFEQTIQKSANGTLSGAQRVDSRTMFDGRQYKVYVLLRYPLGENNILRKERQAAQVQREVDLRAARAHQELEQKQQVERQQQLEEAAQQKEDLGPKPETTPVSRVEPVSVPTSNGEIKLLDVENKDYKQRRAEALEKPGAVIGQTVVR